MKKILILLSVLALSVSLYGQKGVVLQSEESYYRFKSASPGYYDVVKYGLDSIALKVYFAADTIPGHTVDTVIVRLMSKDLYSDSYSVDDSIIWKGTADTSYTFTKGYGVEKFYRLDSYGDSATRYQLNLSEWLFNRK